MSTRKWSLLKLHRPEYVPTPEVIVSDLIWHTFDRTTKSYNDCVRESSTDANSTKPVGLAFTLTRKSRQKKVTVDSSLSNVQAAQGALADKFAPFYGNKRDASVVASAVINSIKSSRPEKSNTTPASPILLETALLQDLRGAMGKENPPAISAIIASMFNLGGLAPSDALNPWWRILREDDQRNIVEKVIAYSCREVLLPEVVSDKLEDVSEQPFSTPATSNCQWVKSAGNTPFHWLAMLWQRLNTPEWQSALPRRRWVDWSICLLRTGMSFGYLWEARLHSKLAAALLEEDNVDNDAILNELLDDRVALLDWVESTGVAARDVASRLKQALRKGLIAMEALEYVNTSLVNRQLVHDESLDSTDAFLNWIAAAKELIRTDETNRKEFLTILEGDSPGGLSNLHESVKYSLQSRDNSDGITDLYSLLKGVGTRYSIVEPSQEWLVTTASLLGYPGQINHLDDYVESLRMLGLRPSLSTVIRKLETAGLAKSTSDVDGALEIRAAF